MMGELYSHPANRGDADRVPYDTLGAFQYGGYLIQGKPYDVYAEAAAYVRLFHEEHGTREQLAQRLHTMQDEIQRIGTYHQSFPELEYGARVAWRNSNRCIGRLYWHSLQVRDMRHLSTAHDIFAACVTHLQEATNGGKIRPIMTVFAPQQPGEPGIRIWNAQLIRYAGYVQPDGTVLGDPDNVALTEQACKLGWRGGAGTPFDVLPVIIQMPGEPPQLFELPADIILEVPISHPDFLWFTDLGLKWHAVPAIANMCCDIGGMRYTAAPFNGWYMVTEVGARNFGDVKRYNMLPVVATKMGLSTRSERSLWLDRALVELNVAVIHSFASQRVTMIDHHAACQHFVQHVEREKQAGRITTGEWSWLVPPLSSSTTPVFSQSYDETVLKPNFFYQPDPWRETSATSLSPYHLAP